MATARKTKPKEFDENVLQGMTEPITVNVSKILGGKLSPVPLPVQPGESVAGRGYVKDQVRELGSFLSQEWTGGGTYEVTVTGANGGQMSWQMYYPVEQYPERVPPTVKPAPAPMPVPAVPLQAPAQPQGLRPSATSLSQLAQSYGGVPAAPYAGQPAAGAAAVYNPYAWQNPAATPFQRPAIPTAANSEVSKEREERIKLEAKMEAERTRSQHEKEMSGINHELRRVQEMMAKKPAAEETAALKAAMDKISQLEQQSSTQMMLQQMQQMQQANVQMMKDMQANTDKQIEAIRREAAESNKSDPMISMFMQSMSTQQQQQQQSQQMMMQVMQQNQSQQLEAARLAQQSQMRPSERLDIFRSANQGADQMASAYGKAWELMAGGVESILQAQGPGVHPALAMAGEALQGVGMMAQQYLEAKGAETQAGVQRAHIEANARLQQEAIRRQPAPGAVHPPGEEPSGVTEGDPMPHRAAEPEVEPEEGVIDVEATEQPPQSSMTPEEREEELFGEALGAIKNFRMGVNGGKLDPQGAAEAILKAIDHFGQQGEMPPVFGLFQQQMFPEFVDVLLPDAKVDYRAQVTRSLIEQFNVLIQQAQRGAQQAPVPAG